MEKEEEERQKQLEEERQKRIEEMQRKAAEEQAKRDQAKEKTDSNEPAPPGLPTAETTVLMANPGIVSSESAKEPPPPDVLSSALTTLGNSFFGGETHLPDGFALALSFEGDSFDLRGLLINAPGAKSDVLPFWPRVIAGAPIMPEAPNIFPASTELFATMSLDLPQIF